MPTLVLYVRSGRVCENAADPRIINKACEAQHADSTMALRLSHLDPYWLHHQAGWFFPPAPLQYICPLCTNMTSPIKPEVHNVSQHQQRRTEPWPKTCTKNSVKIERVLLCSCRATLVERQTDTQTNTVITILCLPAEGEVHTGKPMSTSLEMQN